jgi:hypothetical protein
MILNCNWARSCSEILYFNKIKSDATNAVAIAIPLQIPLTFIINIATSVVISNHNLKLRVSISSSVYVVKIAMTLPLKPLYCDFNCSCGPQFKTINLIHCIVSHKSQTSFTITYNIGVNK